MFTYSNLFIFGLVHLMRPRYEHFRSTIYCRPCASYATTLRVRRFQRIRNYFSGRNSGHISRIKRAARCSLAIGAVCCKAAAETARSRNEIAPQEQPPVRGRERDASGSCWPETDDRRILQAIQPRSASARGHGRFSRPCASRPAPSTCRNCSGLRCRPPASRRSCPAPA